MSLLILLATSGYLLAYAIPLLLLSIPLAFAGAFLTLDRTRMFAPRSDAGYVDNMPGSFDYRRNKPKLVHRLNLQGGLGGLSIGFLFGLHLATFLALVVCHFEGVTISRPAFLVTWVFSVIPTTVVAGLWRYCAFLFVGMTGGTTLALAICIITHPSLETRVVFTSIMLPLLTILTLLPIARTQYTSIRVAASATGAFGIVLAISLFTHVIGWADVWFRLWTQDSSDWGTNAERGLSAAWAVFFFAGMACDWFLHRKFGENPDQKWDSYLAEYAASLPNAPDRAGSFKPMSGSFWSNLLTKPKPQGEDPMLFPDSKALLPSQSPVKLHKQRSMGFATSTENLPHLDYGRPGFLRKKSEKAVMDRMYAHTGRRKPRDVIRFGGDLSSDSEDDGEEGSQAMHKPWTTKRSDNSDTASGVTLNGEDDGYAPKWELDPEKERARIARAKGKAEDEGAPEYSDFEEDVTLASDKIRLERRKSRDVPGWQPEFLKKQRESKDGSAETPSVSSSATAIAPAALRSVPATPSLIKAIDRVARAQQDAYAAGKAPENTPSQTSSDAAEPRKPRDIRPGLPAQKSSYVDLDGLPRRAASPVQEHQRGDRWQSFWRDVKVKAAEY